VLDKLLDDCGVGQLKMSDFGITKEELPIFSREAKKVFEQLFYNDPSMLSEDISSNVEKESAFEKSY
jgi:alcohol dehydrogenase